MDPRWGMWTRISMKRSFSLCGFILFSFFAHPLTENSQLDSALRICLVQNQKTKRAKVVCTRGGEMWNGSRKATPDFQTVIEANRLAISREGSGIHLMKGAVLWARLYFGTYENMTLFKHAFLALRSQGPEAVYTSPSESFQEDVTQERVHFAGYVTLDIPLRL
jgi:hypothetical protein